MDNNLPEKTEEKAKFSKVKYQYVAAFIVNLVTFCQGFNSGWLSPSLQTLQSEDSPLNSGPITTQQTMLLGILSSIGGLIGTIIFSSLSHYLGRINSIRLIAFPSLIFVIILITSNSIEVILIGRLIDGLTMGGMFVCIPLYITEISDSRIRGRLLLTCVSINNLGVLVAYTCGAFMAYENVPYVVIGVPAVFLILMAFLPETPYALLKEDKVELAKDSLRFFYNGNKTDNDEFDSEVELKKIRILISERQAAEQQKNVKLLFERSSLKALGLALSLLSMVVMSGTFAISTYASHVFKQSNADFDANISAIIMGTLQNVAIYASSLLIDSWGRRILFGLSSCLSGIALIIFGTFSFLNYSGVDMTAVFWLPVTSVSLFIFVNGAGMRPLPFVYVAEVLPDNIRNIGTTVCMLAFIGMQILSIGTLPILIEVIKLHTLIWMYAGVCFVGVLFAVFVMEETKGKRLNASKS
ncbi:facilitated trehalose transporter Tret1-like [Bradysia coprophila]|uniref:facilitated trehalose transporter Tret1-like n=1 Tax=Bradysia coprophila TaxID=38358 RepID=UPI00187DA3A9|nr:facilitated trehalose transporter Tret1-like [Bradysia coprophila]